MFHDLFRFGFSGSHQRESLGPPSPASFSDGHPANRDRMERLIVRASRPCTPAARISAKVILLLPNPPECIWPLRSTYRSFPPVPSKLYCRGWKPPSHMQADRESEWFAHLNERHPCWLLTKPKQASTSLSPLFTRLKQLDEMISRQSGRR